MKLSVKIWLIIGAVMVVAALAYLVSVNSSSVPPTLNPFFDSQLETSAPLVPLVSPTPSASPTPIQRTAAVWISDGSAANIQWIYDNCANVDPIPSVCLPYLATPTPVPVSPVPTESPSPSPTATATATATATSTPTATAVPTPEITSVTLDGQPFTDGMNITANVNHTFGVVANAQTHSVVFLRNNTQSYTDSTVPFSWTFAPTSIGLHPMQFTPWSGTGGTGTPGVSVLLHYRVVGPSPTPTP